jgi:hypothetical protein
MLKVIHPRYAVKVMDNLIPNELLDSFVTEIKYYEQLDSIEDVRFGQTKSSPLVYKLFSIGQSFVSKFNIQVLAVEYFIWRGGIPIVMPHVDLTPAGIDSNQPLVPINIRLNVPIYSSGSIMDWFEVKESSDCKERYIGQNGYHDILQITEDTTPNFSISADEAVFVNPAVAHRINMKQTNQDRLSLSFKIKNKFSFEDFVKQIPEQYLK